MRKLFVGAALMGFLAAPLAAQVAPGDPVTRGPVSFYVGPYVGYVWYGDLFEFTDGTEFSLENGAQFGAQAGVSFNPNISLLGNLGYNKSAFVLERDLSQDERRSGDLGVWLYDANLQFRLPFLMPNGGWIAPFGQVGAGAIRYTVDTDDIQGEGNTNIAFNFGVGGDFQFLNRLGMRVMVKDYITSMEWNDLDQISFDQAGEGTIAHNWALTLGLNLGF